MARSLLIWALQTTYTLAAIGLAVYGFNALWLTWKWLRGKAQRPGLTTVINPENNVDGAASTLPRVTVQLPIFNERHVVVRLIDACASMDYPKDRLQIQVLDDSTDDTTEIAQVRAAYWRHHGLQVEVIHRTDRAGYKAGALQHALPQATGQFIAIFDADFKPPRDFLRRTIPCFLGHGNESVAFVQARWGHLNREYSFLTRCQALALDGHFVVEQSGRQAAKYAFGFNGSAGIWRRECIEDPAVGGWQADTLCEDLDLSYRAQLAGWRPLFLGELDVPAEIPPQLSAFKRQQFRWAKGSMQTLLKLAPRLGKSAWPLVVRLEGFLHLGGYLIHPLLMFLLVVTLPLLLLDTNPFWPLAYLSLASVGPPLLYALAQRELHQAGWLRHWAYLPLLTFLGTGLALNNTVAVWQALTGRSTPFLRTPKFQVQDHQDRWERSGYVLPLDATTVGEFLLFCYSLLTIGVAIARNHLWSVPFLLIYAGGFGLMVTIALWQAWHAHRSRTRQRTPPHPTATAENSYPTP